MIGFKYSDGGRADAGYATRRDAGDCVARATAIALHGPNPAGYEYQAIYNALAKEEKALGGRRSARDGVTKKASASALRSLGFEHVGLTAKANGGRWLTLTECWERFRRSMIVVTRGHMSAIVDGKLIDTSDGRTYEWEDDYIIETRERKTATIWLAPAGGAR